MPEHRVDSWNGINQTLHDFYPDHLQKFRIRRYMGYYSTSSVCLPKFFVTVSRLQVRAENNCKKYVLDILQ